MSPVSSLLLALSILQAVLGGLCLAVSRGERPSPALRLWGWSQIVHAGGVLLILAGPPLAILRPAGESLIAAAPLVAVLGVLSHTRARVHPGWRVAAILAAAAPVAVHLFTSDPIIVIDGLTATPIAIPMFAVAAWALMRRPAGPPSTAQRLTAAALVLAAAAWTISHAIVSPASAVAAAPGPAERIAIPLAIGLMASSLAATFGLWWIEVRKLEAAIEKFASADPLTGLPDRRAALTRVKDELARAARHERTFAIVLLDIDRFREIRVRRGPLAGDAVVRHVADGLRAAVRGEDVLSRAGAGSFMLLLPEQGLGGAAATADRLADLVAATPCRYDAWPMNLTMSRGVSVYPADGHDWDTLIGIASRRLDSSRPEGESEPARG